MGVDRIAGAVGHAPSEFPSLFAQQALRKERSVLFFKFFDFFLNVLPHVAMEGDGELTKGTREGSPFHQLRHKVFLFSTADRAREG